MTNVVLWIKRRYTPCRHLLLLLLITTVICTVYVYYFTRKSQRLRVHIKRGSVTKPSKFIKKSSRVVVKKEPLVTVKSKSHKSSKEKKKKKKATKAKQKSKPKKSKSYKKKKRPTTKSLIPTTQFPFVTTKYYTYIDDFLANVDKIPMPEEVKARVETVKQAAMRCKNRELFSLAMTEQQRNIVYDLLTSFDALAKREGIAYFAYGGTLLGSFRHHDIIPWDDDIDIIINEYDKVKLQKAVDETNMTFALSTLSPEHFKLHNRYGEFTNLYHDWTYPYIDISFYKQNSTHLIDIAQTYGRWWEYELGTIFPLHDRPLGPISIPAPKDTYKYLVETYDLNECSENYYSHQLEMVVRCRHVLTDCSKLPFAFVHRSKPSEGSGVNETLVLNGEVLHWKIVQEAEYTSGIGDPYTLKFTSQT